MRILEKEVETVEELDQRLELAGDYRVAVEALIFDQELEWVLMKRGPGCRDEVGKLEGVGGSLEEQDDSFRDAVKRELAEEVGETPDIEIVDFFEVRKDIPDTGETWVIVSFLCSLESGELKVMEPEKNDGFRRVDVKKVDPDRLSSSAGSARESLIEEWSEVKEKLLSGK